MGSKGMAPLILTLGARCSERQNLLPDRFTPDKEPTVPTEKDVDWAPEQVRTG